MAHYLAEQMSCTIEELPDKTDLLMKKREYEGMQRQNTLGIAFVGLIRYLMEKFGSEEITYVNIHT